MREGRVEVLDATMLDGRAPVRERPASIPHPGGPPSAPDSAVARPRLLSLLDLAARQRLTTVVAPPGSGKSLLLVQWLALHEAWRTRWLTLDTRHDDVGHLMADLRDALAPEASPTVGDLVADLPRHEPTLLVLDDFHLLSSPRALDRLASFIERAPRGLRVVVASRVDLPRAYYRIPLGDVLVEIRQEDLAFTADEASELISRITGRVLAPAYVSSLVARTEGWAVGLQLAAVSLAEGAPAEAFVRTFANDHGHVADYLTEQVLAYQQADIQDFLVRTSALDRMEAGLCDAVTDRRDSDEVLQELDRRSMFIVRLGGHPESFRYHGLFCAYLRHHLRDRHPGLEPELLRRAAEWHLERGEDDEAMRYLERARAWREIVGRVRAQVSGPVTRARASSVASWVRTLPREVRQEHPEVALFEGAALAVAGEPAAAAEVLEGVGRGGGTGLDDELFAGVLRTYLLLQRGHADEAVEVSDAVLARIDVVPDAYVTPVLGLARRRSDLRAAAAALRGVALVYQRRWAAAREAFDVDTGEEQVLFRIVATGAQALMAARAGELGKGAQLGGWALSLARQVGIDDHPVTTDAHLALVEVARERGELARAHALLDEASRQEEPVRQHIVPVQLNTERALVVLAAGDPVGALETLSHRAFDPTAVTPAVIARRLAVAAELRLLTGDVVGAAQTLADAPEESGEVVAVQVKLAVHRGELRSARELAERFPADLAPRSDIERWLALAVVAAVEGDRLAATRHLAGAVVAAEPESHVGVFRWHEAVSVVRAAYRDSPAPFLRRILEQPVAVPSGPVGALVEQLTDREGAVLRLLPTRLSNGEIADELEVSLNTVKTHLKHIYRKLQVTQRSEAIVAAERLHLM